MAGRGFALLSTWRAGRAARAARLTLLRMLPAISPGLTLLTFAACTVSVAISTFFIVAGGVTLGAVPPTIAAGGLSSPEGGHLKVWLAITIGLFIVERLLRPLIDSLTNWFGRRVNREIRMRVMDATNKPPGIWHLEDPALLDLVRDAQGAGTGQFTPGMAAIGFAANYSRRLASIGGAVILATFQWWLPIPLLAYGVLTRFRLVDDMVSRTGVATQRTPELRRSDYTRSLALTAGAAKETRIFGLGGWVLDRFKDQWTTAMQQVWKTRKETNASSWMWSIPWGLLDIGALILVGKAAADGQIDLAQLAIYTQAVMSAGGIWLGQEDMYLGYGAASVPAMKRLEDTVATLDAAGAGASVGSLPARDIRFEHVRFAYPGRTEDVYANLNLTIEAGRSIAIVGANGAGKTTLVKLLARLYDPTEGRILADGVDIATLDARAWQRRIAAIFQDFVRYKFTASENVALGGVEKLGDVELVRGAAEKVGIAGAIEQLPKGWDTILSREFTDGADLSGGQWQRLALARALFAVEAGAGVLVLDEPTANLDVRAEAELFDRFLELTQGVTTILISHRFSSVRRADRIVVLDEGRIVEDGTHAELMTLGGLYAEMFAMQASRFLDEQTATDDPEAVDA